MLKLISLQSNRLCSASIAGCCILAASLVISGCSTSSDGRSKVGADTASPAVLNSRTAPRPTRPYDSDGPTYRGGRDPATGRAAQNWPPAAPPSVQQAPVAPLPPTAPAYAAAQPAQPAYSPYYPPQQAAPAYPQQSASQGAIAPAGNSVEVRPGDTLYRIARSYNVSVPSIMQANGLTSESIKVGQRLTIPAR